MGEIADAMLNGVFCASCGEVMGDALDDEFDEPGYPRYCDACQIFMDSEAEASRPKPQSRRAKR